MVTIDVHLRFQMKWLLHPKMRTVLIFFLPNLMISLIVYGRLTSLKSVTMATRNALLLIFELQNFTNTYLGKVTKFQFNYLSRLGVALKKPEGAAPA